MAEMEPIVSQILKGHKASYKIITSLKNGSIFKTAVLPTGSASSQSLVSRLAVFKVEPIDKNLKILYDRELRNLQIPTIASSRHIRALHDTIPSDPEKSHADPTNHRGMILEWMDTDLWNCRHERIDPGSDLPRIVAKAVLEALAVFADLQGIHTDINPNNVLLSGLGTSTPVVKVGDLDNFLKEGIDSVRLQGLAIRAPEVWKGYGCWPASDVWSLGVTMVHWLAAKPIFGASDKMIQGMTEAWCMAKIQRLVGPLGAPIKPEYGEEFATADFLESETFQLPGSSEPTPFIRLGSIRQELERIPDGPVSEECVDFIESLLVVDHTRRPSAREALKHSFITGVK
ncbi:MAG: hypothetical protein M1817_001776 [Caeruleum heppii]|nr:MAG: hypothetical protein M1817_001776 [Caeruleum heppii]